MSRNAYLFGAAMLAVLGTGVAEAASATLHTMKVAAPDGSVVQVRYSGDVAPRVEVMPADAAIDAAMPADMPVMADPFAGMERISAIMDAQVSAMMQRAALMQQQAAQMQQHAVANGAVSGAPGLTVVGDMPQGMHVTYYSSSTDASGCTRSVSYSSDGKGAAPKMTQAASDNCDAAARNPGAVPAKAEKPVEQPAAQAPAPGQKV
jgi:hypothetical protein